MCFFGRIVFLCAFVTSLHAADSLYADRPGFLGEDQAALLDQYVAIGRSTLGDFDAALAERDEDRTYAVVTRIQAEEGELYEQVFVEVDVRTEGGYRGRIASEPTGRVKFERGSAIYVPREEVFDWVVINPDGTETGNVVGKAGELMQVGVAVVIFSMEPVAGRFERFAVVSVQNASTRQEVIELLPEDVKEAIESDLEAQLRGQDSEGADETRFGYILVRFPGWAPLNPNESEP